MGFSLTGAHVIFFIAAVIVAGTVSGVFIAVSTNLSGSFSERGDRIREEFDTEFSIINDPDSIPNQNNNYLFYIKNIGGNKLVTTNTTIQIFIDGDIIPLGNYTFSVDTIYPSDYSTLSIDQEFIGSGYHVLRVIGPLDVKDSFIFNI
jgi:flagellar protein FlaG